jgi:putative membrane protein
MSEPSDHDLAIERTELARQRTLLAKQRTFSAWIRTGLATVALGLAAAQLLGDLEPQWPVVTIAALLSLAGIAIFAVAYWSYYRTMQELEHARAYGIPVGIIGAITAIFMVSSAIAVLVILFT